MWTCGSCQVSRLCLVSVIWCACVRLKICLSGVGLKRAVHSWSSGQCVFGRTHSSLYFPFVWLMSSLLPPPSSLCYWYHLSFRRPFLTAALDCVFYSPVTLRHCHLASFGSVNGNLEITSSLWQDTWAIHCSLSKTVLNRFFFFLSSAPSSEASIPFTNLMLFLLAPEWSQMFLQYLLFHNSFPVFHFVWQKGQD